MSWLTAGGAGAAGAGSGAGAGLGAAGGLSSLLGSTGNTVSSAAGGVGPPQQASGLGAFGRGFLQGLSGGQLGGGPAAEPVGLNAGTFGQLLGSRMGQGGGTGQGLQPLPMLSPQGAPGGGGQQQQVDPQVLYAILARILQSGAGGA